MSVRRQLNVRNYVLEDEATQRQLFNSACDPNNTFSFRNPYSAQSVAIQQEDMTIHKLHIDSAQRRRIPEHIFDTTRYLEPNKLYLEEGSSRLLVELPQHGLVVDDRVAITGVAYPEFRLKNALRFAINSTLVAITHPEHGITQEMIDIVPFNIQIRGVTGTNNSINGVPVSLINGTHEVVLRATPSDPIDPNLYYIRVQLPANATGTDTTNNVFEVRYLNVFGMPVNVLNATYPISERNVRGFHSVVSVVDEDAFEVDVGVVAAQSVAGFGEGVVVQKIATTQPAYPRSNEYTIFFPTPYKNVKLVRIINSEFPIVQYLINSRNNTLQFQLLDDGDDVYEVTIPDGNYGVDSLVEEIRSRINATPRFGRDTLFINDNTNAPLTLHPNVICDIQYSIDKNFIQFSFFDEVGLIEPLQLDATVYADLKTRMFINYKSHGLVAGDVVTVRGAAALQSVPAEVLNATFVVEAVADENTVRVVLERYNELLVASLVPRGGKQVVVRRSLVARLLLEDATSVGAVIGFHKVGEEGSITSYATNITNKEAYPNELLIDSLGNPAPIDSVFRFSPDNYIFMVTDLVFPSTNTNGVTNALAKIGLYGDNGTYIYDSYNQLARPFDENISELASLSVRFVDKNGALYDFYDYDHSYILEIFEERTTLITAGKSTRQ